jgi:hypothetical protein
MLCAKLASAFNLQVTNILTDNQVLADAATSSSMLRSLGRWSLRPILAAPIDATRGRNYSVLKIRREMNKVADKVVKQARHASITQALAHSQYCNVQVVLQNFEWGLLYPIYVPCL